MTYLGNSRRNFLKTLTTTALVSGSSLSGFANIVGKTNERSLSETTGSNIAQNDLPPLDDGPASPLFQPLEITGNFDIAKIDPSMVSERMAEVIKSAPTGNSVAWGIPFDINKQTIFLKREPFRLNIKPRLGNWIIFMHTTDRQDLKRSADGFYEKPFRGIGSLNEEIARYFVIYEDGKEVSLPIRQILGKR